MLKIAGGQGVEVCNRSRLCLGADPCVLPRAGRRARRSTQPPPLPGACSRGLAPRAARPGKRVEAAPLLSPPRPQGQSAAQRRRGGSVPGGRAARLRGPGGLRSG